MTTKVQFTVYLDIHGAYHRGDELNPHKGLITGYCQQQAMNMKNELEMIPCAVVYVSDQANDIKELFVVPVHEMEVIYCRP